VTVLLPVGAWAVSASNVAITDASSGYHAIVGPAGALHTVSLSGLPGTQFSLPPQQVAATPGGATTMKPEPSGTRYAITSFTVSNPSTQTFTVQVKAISATIISGGGCGFIANAVHTVSGPVIVVGPNSTVSLTYPQPFVLSATGAPECLAVGGGNVIGEQWSLVGYTF